MAHETRIAAGPPASPLAFPTPTIHRAQISHANLFRGDGQRDGVPTEARVLCRATRSMGENAYLIQSRIARSSHGSVYLCIVLKRRRALDDEWIASKERVAVKCSSFQKMRQDSSASDPLREAACLQFLGSYDSNVLGCLEVLRDDSFLYVVMPYCMGGCLKAAVGVQDRKCDSDDSSASDQTCASAFNDAPSLYPVSCSSFVRSIASQSSLPIFESRECRARRWFLQLLSALSHLQTKGVYHGNLNLSNILLEDADNLVVVGFSHGLRVPYTDGSNLGCISDVSEGKNRLPILVRRRCLDSLTFVDPEILENKNGVDGFAADLWSAGVLLFVLLTGGRPFDAPVATDRRYMEISRGRLKQLVESTCESAISHEAYDLLQCMLQRNPSKRPSLAQVLRHPWILGPETAPLPIAF